MDFMENVMLALAGLRSNKMRAALTMLGIIIGIGSVIAIATVGNSLNASITAQMEEMGANSIMVNVRERGQDFGGPGRNSESEVDPEEDDLLSEEDIDNFAARFSNKVDTISLSYNVGTAQAQEGQRYANVSIVGVNNGYIKANSMDITSGRFISTQDVKAARRVAVVSDKLLSSMYPTVQDPIGLEVRTYSDETVETYTVVGVYKYEANSFLGGSDSERDISTDLYIPVSLAKQDAETQNYQSFIIVTKTGVNVQTFTQEIKDYYAKVYENNTKYEATAMNMESMISNMTSMLSTVSMAISVIAGISLLVGGIGVMNIMLVSVTERTREIGTRKALGARNFSIKMQFIVESVIICTIGGIIGIILGLILGAGGAIMMGYPAKPTIGIVILSVGITMLIGVFFGYYPANKAAQMDPIEALRYE